MIYAFTWRDIEYQGTDIGITGVPIINGFQRWLRAKEKKGFRFISACPHPAGGGRIMVVMRKEHS